jgi:hypothetical protein
MEHFFEKALSLVSSAEGAAITIALILDFVFRLIPSEKPKSVIYMVAKGIKMSGELLTKLGSFLDKVLGQKIK